MSVKEYSLKLTHLSKYAPTFVTDPKARIHKFVIGVFSLMEKECCTTMLLNDMDIYRIMVYAKQIEDSKLKKMT